ncbi:hypothetical protein ACFCV3_39655 [Kribbella sp. NPDC056345]|uniref:hypothetical protein n=1 Tax=Kribbella sp. NPDC056345 TaxID=3345789 RepID=UPI0035D96307
MADVKDMRQSRLVSSDDPNLAALARSFLSAAWSALREERIIPRPRFDSFIQVGQDYEGATVSDLPEYAALEATICRSHARFQDEQPLGQRDFAASYIYSFLECFVAKALRAGMGEATAGPEMDESIRDLEAALASDVREMVSCRLVVHLNVRGGSPLEIGGVKVVPARDGQRRAVRIFEAEIPRSAGVYQRVDPQVYGPPESVVVARDSESRGYEADRKVGAKIDRFLLLVRLLKSSTCATAFGIEGEGAEVRQLDPYFLHPRGPTPGVLSGADLLRRTALLDEHDVPRFEGLSTLLDAVPYPQGVLISSFRMGVQKFQVSFHAHAWYEQVVDLATAFEAMLAGVSAADVTMRLKFRAASLLSATNDPPGNIFKDVGQLYGLRSKLVHGGSLTEKELKKLIYTVSTVSEDEAFGTAISHAVDRLRDLVRRSILVRLCLAAEGSTMWPLGNDAGVDASLASPETADLWRASCRRTLQGFGASAALDRPAPAVWHVARDDSGDLHERT